MSRRIIGLGILALLVTAVPLAAQRRAMTIVDLIDIPGLGDPRISPDGSEVLYVRRDTDWEANGTVSHVWRVAMDGSGSVQMTNGEDGESTPRWSPDGSRIAFVANRHDTERNQIYVMPTRGGEARIVSEHPTPTSSIAWSVDGAWIFFVAVDEKSEAEKAREAVNDNVFRYEEDRRPSGLWRVPSEGGAAERVTEPGMMVRGYSISRDGMLLLVQLAPTALYDDLLNSELWVMAPDGSGARQITDNHVGEVNAFLSPDNGHALFIANTNDELSDFYFNQRLFVVPTDGGDPVSVLPGGRFDVNAAMWSRDGRTIFFRANTGVRQQLYSVPADASDAGRAEPVTEGDHAVGAWDYHPASGTHLFSINNPTNAGDLWAMAGSGSPRRVTRVLDYLAAEFLLPRVEAVQYPGEDGVQVEGLIFYPIDYQEGVRYPLVVQTHGGPPSSDKFGFSRSSNYEAVLAARGWFVFKPNYRGSTGYGDAFLRNMIGNYFDQAHKDVMAGVDHLVDRGLVDGDRMAKMGWSAGGHMTNKIITYTDRFKAASSGAGAVNWMSMYAQSDVRIYRTPWFGGTPWSEDAPIEQYMADSPLFDLHKVVTPTLVLVGENDARVPMPQSVELYQGLKHNGVPTHLYVAPEQGHGWVELQQRLFKANVELDWYYQWVLDEEYEWETSPVHPEKQAAVTTAGGGR
ncbi:S9 family peptidase [Candidatus Palauibacter sp.]|uniref:S9 family peptidase n=1 Tax=Candidatus Palauibacter sp. TaxID=3101350 RepID=UPI003CC6D83F